MHIGVGGGGKRNKFLLLILVNILYEIIIKYKCNKYYLLYYLFIWNLITFLWLPFHISYHLAPLFNQIQHVSLPLLKRVIQNFILHLFHVLFVYVFSRNTKDKRHKPPDLADCRSCCWRACRADVCRCLLVCNAQALHIYLSYWYVFIKII